MDGETVENRFFNAHVYNLISHSFGYDLNPLSLSPSFSPSLSSFFLSTINDPMLIALTDA